MKKILFFFVVCSVSLSLSAAPIGKDKAYQQAVKFMQTVNAQATLAPAVAHKSPRKNAAATADDAYYYVFNAQAGRGFVIVSGDDRTETILGYSDSGTFSENDMPVNLRAWLDEYARQIQWMDDNHITVSADEARKARAARKAATPTRNYIAPLVTSVWDQTTPYNNQCPSLTNYAGNSATTTYTGCVATAMAQVMYYNRWPQAATKQVPAYTMSYPYYDTSYNVTTQSMEMDALPPTTLDWNNMLNDYSDSYTTSQGNAVATLMRYCGQSVKMEYGTSFVGGSGTQTSKVAAALVNYFGYDENTVRYEKRVNYTIDDWEMLIYNELAAGRPVVYSGQSDGGGHAFVCDGYSYDGYYHINWGWSGSSNGYYLLSVLAPGTGGSGASSTSNGYNYSQGAVVGVRPGQAPADNGTYTEEPGIGIHKPFALTKASDTQWTTPLTIINGTSDVVKIYQVIFGIHDEAGNIVNAIGGTIDYSLSPSYYISLTVTINNTAVTTDGTYTFKPMWRPSSDAAWEYMEGADTYYLKAVVSGGQITSLMAYPNAGDLNVESCTYNGTPMVGMNQSVTYTIRNTSTTDDYNGRLYLFANGSSNQLSANGVAIRAGETVDIEMHFTASKLAADNYTILLAADDGCANVLHTSSLTLEESTGYASSLNALTITSANGTRSGTTYTAYGDDFIDAEITAVNTNDTPFRGQITLWLYQRSGNSYSSVEQKHIAGVVVPANGSTTLNYTLTGLTKGTQYRILTYYYAYATGNWSSYMGTTYHVLNDGMTYWTADGTRKGAAASGTVTIPADAVAVNISGITPTSVTPNSNPNTLYYIGESQSVPSGLSGKNIIKGEAADNISLTADYAFYAPKDFTASNITYTRTFTKGHGNTSDATEADKRSGWETIVLPFAPTSVTTDSRELSFFPTDDDGGDYWLYEFGACDYDNNTVYFTYPTSFMANRPYIISVPGDKWGNQWNLTGKPIVFSADNATIYADRKPITSTIEGNYKFVGNYSTDAISNIYALNSAGNKFTLSASTTVIPFGAYFTTGTPELAALAPSLQFVVGNGTTTGISTIKNEELRMKNAGWYTLDGRRIQGNNANLPKGIYITGGKKVTVK